MQFTIKETSSKEREQEIQEIYEKIKPDYQNKMLVKDILKKHNINRIFWNKKIIPLLKENGIIHHINPHEVGNIGVKYVHKYKNSNNKYGYNYVYQYRKKGKKITFNSINLHKLKQRVLDNNLEWIITDENKYDVEYLSNPPFVDDYIDDLYNEVKELYIRGYGNKKIINNIPDLSRSTFYKRLVPRLKEDGVYYNNNKNKYMRRTGVKYVSKVKAGDTFRYKYNNGFNISSVDINKLKNMVLDKNLEWTVLNKDLAEEEGLVV